MASVDLYWLPLGAGGRFVRLNGRVFEALASLYGGRPALDLYHSALEVRLGEIGSSSRWAPSPEVTLLPAVAFAAARSACAFSVG